MAALASMAKTFGTELAQKTAQMAIYREFEHEEKRLRAIERQHRRKKDDYDPYLEDIIIDRATGTVVIRGDAVEDGDEMERFGVPTDRCS